MKGYSDIKKETVEGERERGLCFCFFTPCVSTTTAAAEAAIKFTLKCSFCTLQRGSTNASTGPNPEQTPRTELLWSWTSLMELKPCTRSARPPGEWRTKPKRLGFHVTSAGTAGGFNCVGCLCPGLQSVSSPGEPGGCLHHLKDAYTT